jgi:methyl acetate hydrolase
VDRVSERPWGLPTLDVVVRSTSSRHAARLARVHHSTMQTRVDALATDLGFDPFEGYGRVRAGIAYLTWRLQRSRVLELPAPVRSTVQRA